jgi:hypothetical protein
MTHAYTKQELRNIADAMGDDDVLLGDTWDRAHFNYAYQVNLSPELWRQFIDDCSNHCGLEDLRDEIDGFIDGLPPEIKKVVDPERYRDS